MNPFSLPLSHRARLTTRRAVLGAKLWRVRASLWILRKAPSRRAGAQVLDRLREASQRERRFDDLRALEDDLLAALSLLETARALAPSHGW
jgi:hypothetical protein